ncbi:hypothetical protein B0I35DRAFT_458291 [Stachybotrys elegans]|uniref:Uncharacterized protein n=1 Tax=Stachybotrys elegans TaxID=80388 RepID=A0A8K0STL7_9HYPO|nr:hypothetical protein B0I35DRAFT_458291 [Stachybotrys elegans]
MVSFKVFLTTLALQGLIASATPTKAVSATGGAGTLAEEGQIRYCDEKNWNGECRTVAVPLNRCHNLPSRWNNRIGSIRNQINSHKCWWYLQNNCEGKNYDNQKDANLSDGDGLFDNSISSYICVRK